MWPFLGRLIGFEVHSILKSHRWYLPACGILAVLYLVLPYADARQTLLPIALIIPLPLIADLGCRESLHRVTGFVFSARWIFELYPLWKWGVGFTISLLATNLMFVRLWFASPETGFAALVSLCLVSALALTVGMITDSGRLFALLYVVFWYLGNFEKDVPAWLDYMSLHHTPTPGVWLGQFSLAVGLIALGTVWMRWKHATVGS